VIEEGHKARSIPYILDRTHDLQPPCGESGSGLGFAAGIAERHDTVHGIEQRFQFLLQLNAELPRQFHFLRFA